MGKSAKLLFFIFEVFFLLTLSFILAGVPLSFSSEPSKLTDSFNKVFNSNPAIQTKNAVDRIFRAMSAGVSSGTGSNTGTIKTRHVSAGAGTAGSNVITHTETRQVIQTIRNSSATFGRSNQNYSISQDSQSSNDGAEFISSKSARRISSKSHPHMGKGKGIFKEQQTESGARLLHNTTTVNANNSLILLQDTSFGSMEYDEYKTTGNSSRGKGNETNNGTLLEIGNNLTHTTPNVQYYKHDGISQFVPSSEHQHGDALLLETLVATQESQISSAEDQDNVISQENQTPYHGNLSAGANHTVTNPYQAPIQPPSQDNEVSSAEYHIHSQEDVRVSSTRSQQLHTYGTQVPTQLIQISTQATQVMQVPTLKTEQLTQEIQTSVIRPSSQNNSEAIQQNLLDSLENTESVGDSDFEMFSNVNISAKQSQESSDFTNDDNRTLRNIPDFNESSSSSSNNLTLQSSPSSISTEDDLEVMGASVLVTTELSQRSKTKETDISSSKYLITATIPTPSTTFPCNPDKVLEEIQKLWLWLLLVSSLCLVILFQILFLMCYASQMLKHKTVTDKTTVKVIRPIDSDSDSTRKPFVVDLNQTNIDKPKLSLTSARNNFTSSFDHKNSQEEILSNSSHADSRTNENIFHSPESDNSRIWNINNGQLHLETYEDNEFKNGQHYSPNTTSHDSHYISRWSDNSGSRNSTIIVVDNTAPHQHTENSNQHHSETFAKVSSRADADDCSYIETAHMLITPSSPTKTTIANDSMLQLQLQHGNSNKSSLKTSCANSVSNKPKLQKSDDEDEDHYTNEIERFGNGSGIPVLGAHSQSSMGSIVSRQNRQNELDRLKYNFLDTSSKSASGSQHESVSSFTNHATFLNTYNRLERRVELERQRVVKRENVRMKDFGSNVASISISGGKSAISNTIVVGKNDNDRAISNLHSLTYSSAFNIKDSGYLSGKESTLIVNKKEGWFRFDDGSPGQSGVTKIQKIVQIG